MARHVVAGGRADHRADVEAVGGAGTTMARRKPKADCRRASSSAQAPIGSLMVICTKPLARASFRMR